MRALILAGVSLLSALNFVGESRAQTNTAAPPPASAATPAAKPVAQVRAADRVICRKDDVTGSRVRKQKTCRTQREWDRLSKRGGSVADELGRERENDINPRPAGG
jgi:hypothetical protein